MAHRAQKSQTLLKELRRICGSMPLDIQQELQGLMAILVVIGNEPSAGHADGCTAEDDQWARTWSSRLCQLITSRTARCGVHFSQIICLHLSDLLETQPSPLSDHCLNRDMQEHEDETYAAKERLKHELREYEKAKTAGEADYLRLIEEYEASEAPHRRRREEEQTFADAMYRPTKSRRVLSLQVDVTAMGSTCRAHLQVPAPLPGIPTQIQLVDYAPTERVVYP